MLQHLRVTCMWDMPAGIGNYTAGFTTGRGTTYGLEMAPVIKVSSRTDLSEKWKDLIDIDAGKIVSSDATIEEVGMEILSLFLRLPVERKSLDRLLWYIQRYMPV